MSNSAEIAKECDKLFDQEDFLEIYNMLKNEKELDLELSYRMARAVRFLVLSKSHTNKKEKQEWIKNGIETMKEAVEKWPNNCLSNTWYGIMLNVKSKEAGVNERIKLGYEIRDYFEKGLKANPQSFLANHAMGSWCYEVSSLSKVARAFAKAFFGKPPSSSYEEALKYFEAAYKAEPTHMLNLCRLAQTYDKLEKGAEAKDYALMAMKYPARDTEMEEALKEVKAIATKYDK